MELNLWWYYKENIKSIWKLNLKGSKLKKNPQRFALIIYEHDSQIIKSGDKQWIIELKEWKRSEIASIAT